MVPKRLAIYKDGGSAKNRILALVKRTHPLIIDISQSTQENKKKSSTLRGVFGGLVILVHPRPMIRDGTLLQSRKD